MVITGCNLFVSLYKFKYNNRKISTGRKFNGFVKTSICRQSVNGEAKELIPTVLHMKNDGVH